MMSRSTVKSLAPILALGLFVTGAWAEVVSGLAPGSPTPAMPVLDVTGPYAGKRTCYVCEFKNDPNVIAFFRDADDQTADLIVQLDKLYRQEKKNNFKAVAILVAGPDAKTWLQELSKSHKIEIPLVVLAKGPQDVGIRLYKIDPKVRNTFLVTRNRAVEANVANLGPGDFDRVKKATAGVLAKSRT